MHFAWELPADPVRGLKACVRRITYELAPIGSATRPAAVDGRSGREPAATDTDSASASATTGTPIIALAGARLPMDRTTGQPLPVRLEAGSVWQLSDNGRMDTLDTSAQLAELRQRIDHLMDRLASNTPLTTAGIGSLDPAKVPSGYALRLVLSPLDSLVGAMRLARNHKYQLPLRMVQRLHQAGQAWPAGESLPARLVCVWRTRPPTAPPSSRTSRQATRRACSAWRPQCGCCRKPGTPSTSPGMSGAEGRRRAGRAVDRLSPRAAHLSPPTTSPPRERRWVGQ
ncbi:hypothetical protein [Streptomyces sp. NTH33]|uniref:hypothetical protein n=1 Tax=Streptomyces sp. NTH33 TaxID=1735453 RepID=UPI0011B943AB|nr:hypothetical protein [Streptomyces sp. NTH33]